MGGGITGVGILGGSNLGYCYAADLSRRGVDTKLWVRAAIGHEAVLGSGRLRLTGVAGEHDVPVGATEDLDRVLANDLLIVAIPTWAIPC